ncbi:hypothetical protein [Paenibacillus swuensis]|uniref:hypothetical protein n=1 Tax=Paenibacillus swuensis TaxID=1178515 RepID=UPI000837E5F4|nr:hypothetical protein [Paenibacillus swuensis]
MLILSSGITGFLPAPSVKENTFKQLCYSIFDSRVIDYIGSDPGKNFYECIVKDKVRNIHILLNGQYPFIALTSTREINVHYFPFIDEPEIAKPFKQYYKLLTPNQLNEPLRYTQQGEQIIVINENTLHQNELIQLVYWEPKTVGDVVFNYWD